MPQKQMSNNDKTSRNVTGLADGQMTMSGSRRWRRNETGFWVCSLGTKLHSRVVWRRTDQETKKKGKPKMNMNRKKIKNILRMKKTMKMNRKKKTMMKALIKVETKMNMKKSIETNPMLNMKISMNVNENMNELVITHESHDECEEECEDEAEYDAANG
jgi:hypothetical protein